MKKFILIALSAICALCAVAAGCKHNASTTPAGRRMERLRETQTEQTESDCDGESCPENGCKDGENCPENGENSGDFRKDLGFFEIIIRVPDISRRPHRPAPLPIPDPELPAVPEQGESTKF